jgi:histidinol-phosphate aminotransferase
MFRIVSEIAGGRVIDVPARDLSLDRDAFLENAAHARFVWICNPNNPTGELLPADFIESILRAATTAVVAVDEAYYEVSGMTVVPLIERYPNLVVVRTLSKAFGLAGMRVGYALAGDAITAALRRVRPPGSISVISEALAVRSLNDLEGMRERVRQVVAAREALAAELAQSGLNALPSAANFLLVRTGADVGPALLRQGLVVRTFPRTSPLTDYVRITVRKPEENSRVVQALAAIAPPRVQTRL